jgi:hypothetical protein
VEQPVLDQNFPARVFGLLFFLQVDAVLKNNNKTDKKTGHQKRLDIVQILINSRQGDDQGGKPETDMVAAYHPDNVGAQKNNPAFAPEYKEDDDYAQYKISRHAAGNAAQGKKGQGKEKIAERNKKNPKADSVPFKTVAEKQQRRHQKGDAQHDDNQKLVGPHEKPGYGGRQGRRDSHGTDHIQHFRVQRKAVGKNITLNQSFYFVHQFDIPSVFRDFLVWNTELAV